MSGHTWRQGHGIDPFREWIRRELPSAYDGIVTADLDVAFRRYGVGFGLDGDGDLMLIEKKEYLGKITGGERRIYNWIDGAIRTGKFCDRWRGCHELHVNYQDECPTCSECGQPVQTAQTAYERFASAKLAWDGKPISHEDLKNKLLGNVESIQFGHGPRMVMHGK